ncbi:hypothetical protein BGZ83_008311 [Gryganskiella cystojenkinii]|nr:hypothetical protein BGZ83_008311 [Gryganskiella cystojenkinii]
MEIILPHRIKHHPGVVLQVHINSIAPADTSNNGRTDGHSGDCHPTTIPDVDNPISSASTSGSHTSSTTTLAESVSTLNISEESSSAVFSAAEPRRATITRRDTTHIMNQFNSVASAIELARQSGKPLNADGLLTLMNSTLVPALVSKPGFESEVIQRLTTIEKTTKENLEMSKQIIDRLILIQSKTEAILTQQLELSEYPIPRLFIVLPEEVTPYDPRNWFRTRFRLHFICECGEHTKVPGSKLSNHLHLAKHGGYLIREPTKFFDKYGPFLLLMLELIKFGTSIAGHVVPTLASLKVVELADSVIQTAESITAQIDYSLQCIDGQLGKIQGSSSGDFIDTSSGDGMTQQDLANYLSGIKGLEGVELRQLGSFLKAAKDENLLGNLYRMTTSHGHVKWVCLDHYRAGYQEANTQKLRDAIAIARGQFDEQLGRVTITLRTRFAATEFFNRLSKAKGILELIVEFSDECSRSELQALEEALKTSRVSILRLDLRHLQTSRGSKLLSASTRYDALFRIRENPNMQAIHYILPAEVTKILSFPVKKSHHTCKLSLDMGPTSIGEKDLRALGDALKSNSTLAALNLRNNSVGEIGAQVIGEGLKTNLALTTLELGNNPVGDAGARALGEGLQNNSVLTMLDLGNASIGDSGGQALANALKVNSTLIELNFRNNPIGDIGVQALAEGLTTNSSLATLVLGSISVSDKGAQALANALKKNLSLRNLNLESNSIGDAGAQALGESLKMNSALTWLELRNNTINDTGAQELGEALKNNSALTLLSLSRNSIGDVGAQALGEGLKANTTLTILRLDFNSIGDTGACAIGEGLKTNQALFSVELEKNSFGDDAAKVMAEALKTNSTLSKLDLAGNRISPVGAQVLGESLKINSSLTALILVGNSIENNESRIISKTLQTIKCVIIW